jgi:hypothetical protein
MDVRCSGCNKLFRISDEKITGKGIKFTCSKCGEIVKVTREEFEQYQLSLSAVSVLDSFIPQPKKPPVGAEPGKPETPPVFPEAMPPAAETLQQEPPVSMQTAAAVHEAASAETAIPDFLQEKEEPAAFESSPFIEFPQESTPESIARDTSVPANENPFDNTAEQKAPEREETVSAPTASVEPVMMEAPVAPSQTPLPERETKKEAPEPEPTERQASSPEPAVVAPQAFTPEAAEKAEVPQTRQEQKPVLAAVAEPKVAEKVPVTPPEPEKRPVSKPAIEGQAVPAEKAKPTPQPKPVSPATAQPQKRTPPRPAAAPQSKVVTAAPQKAGSGNMTIQIITAVILLALIGAGAYFLLTPESKAPSGPMVSPAGLRIENIGYQAEANGDLLITGTVVNETDKPQDAWMVVVDAFDASGGVIKKMRVFKGKQLYSKSDYDILQKRGVNIQELKSQIHGNPGIIIPPKGSVNYEVRYLQSPPSIANLQAILQPYDPVRLEKEIAAETK